MFNRVQVDINNELLAFEQIIATYAPQTVDILNSGVWLFVPFKRFPITNYTDKAKYSRAGVVFSREPALPFIGMYCLKRYVENCLNVGSSREMDTLFRKNVFTDRFEVLHVDAGLDYFFTKDIDASRLMYNHIEDMDYKDKSACLIPSQDYLRLEAIADSIVMILSKLTSSYLDHVFRLDIEGPNVELVNLGSIHEYRHKEMLSNLGRSHGRLHSRVNT